MKKEPRRDASRLLRWFMLRFNRSYLVALLLPLLILLAVPQLRVPARRLASGQYRALFPLPLQPKPGLGMASEPAPLSDAASLEEQIVGIARNDFPPRLRQFQNSDGRNSRLRSIGKFLAYAELAREHPDRILPLVCALNWMQGRDGRIAGPWEDPAGWTKSSGSALAVIQTTPSTVPFRAWKPPNSVSARPENNYLPSDMRLALQLARRGQKLEPNNTFFDWMAARALFALRRDDEATQVLIAASRKTGFDLHYRDWWATSFRVAGRGEPLLAEEKTAQAAEVLLPYINNLNHVQRLSLWHAMQKEDAGDVAGALEIEAALMRLLMTMHRRALLDIEASIAANLVQGVWRAPADMAAFRRLRPSLQKPAIGPDMARLNRDVAAFELYARRHNRPDLAREAATWAAELQASIEQNPRRASQDLLLWLRGDNRAAALSSASAVLALWQAVGALGLWLFFWVWGPHFSSRSEGGEAPPRLSTRFLVVAMALGVALSLALAMSERFVLTRVWDAGFAPNGRLMADFIGEKLALWASVAAIAAPFLAAMVAALRGAWGLKLRTPLEEKHEFSPRELGAPEELDWMQNAARWVQKWLWLLFLPAMALTLWLFETVMVAASPVIAISMRREVTQAFEVCAAAWLVYVFWRVRFVGPRAHRGAVYAGFFALRRCLAWTIPLSLWLLVLSLWMGVAPRARAEAQWQKFVASENRP